MMTENQPSDLLTGLMQAAHAAGSTIMQIYDAGFDVSSKADSSPVTEADTAAEKIIISHLKALAPGSNIIAEEAVADGAIPEASDEFYLVDPLDGTREFISRNGEFTVNIALVRDGAPVAGVVYAPALKRIYAGESGTGAWVAEVSADQPWPASLHLAPLAAPQLPATGVKAVASRSHRDEKTEAWLTQHNIAETVAAGSSLKFCLLAEGKAHLYPRFGRTMEWDTAAGHAVLAAAGGSVCVAETGAPLTYGKQERGFDNPAFVASVATDGI
jgi:3'(2'), 5'-bisphosphate nucleotidase